MLLFIAGTAGLAQAEDPLLITKQGSFAAGGTISQAQEKFNPLAPDALNQTLHGDHASVFYQIPAEAKKTPLVFLHGAGQSSRTWESTPDGRDGFQNIFLRRGFPIYLGTSQGVARQEDQVKVKILRRSQMINSGFSNFA